MPMMKIYDLRYPITLILLMFISGILSGQIKDSIVDSTGKYYLKLSTPNTEKYIQIKFAEISYSYSLVDTSLFQIKKYLKSSSRGNQNFIFVISRTDLNSISLQEVNYEYFTVSTLTLNDYSNDDDIFLMNNSLNLKNGDVLSTLSLDNFEQLNGEINIFFK